MPNTSGTGEGIHIVVDRFIMKSSRDPNEIYHEIIASTVLICFDRSLVDEDHFRQLCDEFQQFIPQVDLRRIAIHESGHAVVLMALGIRPNRMDVSTEQESQVNYDLPLGRFERGLDEQIDYFAIKIAGQVAEEIIYGTAKGVEQDFLEHIPMRILTALLPGDRERLVSMDTPFSQFEPEDYLGLPYFKLWAAAHQRAHSLLTARKAQLMSLADKVIRRSPLFSDEIEDGRAFVCINCMHP